MKQLRNILTPLVLFCLLAAGFPVFAQEQEEAAPKMQDEMTSKEEKELLSWIDEPDLDPNEGSELTIEQIIKGNL